MHDSPDKPGAPDGPAGPGLPGGPGTATELEPAEISPWKQTWK